MVFNSFFSFVFIHAHVLTRLFLFCFFVLFTVPSHSIWLVSTVSRFDFSFSLSCIFFVWFRYDLSLMYNLISFSFSKNLCFFFFCLLPFLLFYEAVGNSPNANASKGKKTPQSPMETGHKRNSSDPTLVITNPPPPPERVESISTASQKGKHGSPSCYPLWSYQKRTKFDLSTRKVFIGEKFMTYLMDSFCDFFSNIFY